MVYVNDFEKFCFLINDLEKSGVQIKLFGHIEEATATPAYSFDTTSNSTLNIHIAALTSIGSFYCNHKTDLKDEEAVKTAKTNFERLTVLPAKISCDSNGNLKLS